MAVSYSDFRGGRDHLNNNNANVEWGEGNINQNPLFAEPDEGDYHITADSPCIDAGDPDYPEDPDGTHTDMGAYYSEQGGTLEGLVFDVENDAPLENATVTTSIGQSTQTNEEGLWRIDYATIGDFDITASLQGYNDSTRMDFHLDVDDTLTIDFYLLHPTFIADHQIRVDLMPDSSLDVDFTIENDGNGPLIWSVEPRPTKDWDYQPWQYRDSLALGEIIDDSRIEGVVFAEDRFFISSRQNDYIYVLNFDGQCIDTLIQPGGGGFSDLAWDGELIWGSSSDTLFGMTTEGEFVDTLEGPERRHQALAWDPIRNLLWVSGITSNISAVNRNGEVIETLDRCNLRIYGLAFWADDPDSCQLYIFCDPGNDNHQLLYKMNIETGDTMFVMNLGLRVEGSAKGAFISDQFDIYNWTFMSVANNGANDRIDIWQIDANMFWMSVEPEEGTINPNEEQELTLTLDATQLEVDDCLESRLVFTHNAAGGEAEILVIMRVTLDVDNHQTNLPVRFELFPAYPNPFNSSTTITYSLPVAAQVSLVLYDLSGRQVSTLVEGNQQAGVHRTVLKASGLPSGLYFVRLDTNKEVFTQKVMLIR